MQNNENADLFDYATNEPSDDSTAESSESSETKIANQSSNSSTCQSPAPEGGGDPRQQNSPGDDDDVVCPCYHEEQARWSEALENLPTHDVKCGHAIDYLCEDAGVKIRESTAEQYSARLRLFVEYLHTNGKTVCEAEFEDIDRYFKHRVRTDRSASTVAGDRVVITNLYKHISLYREAESNFDWVLIREEIKIGDYKTASAVEREPLTREQLKKLFDEMNNFRNKLMMQTAVELGPRNSALLAIKSEDLDLDEQKAVLENRKAGGEYHLPITDELTLLLRRWIDTERQAWPKTDNHDYLFPNQHGGKMTRARFTNIVRNAAERAGIQKTLKKIPLTDRQKEVLNSDKEYREFNWVTPHTLRHTFSDLLKQAGLSLEERSKALDHNGTEVTKEFYDEDDDEYADIIRDLFSGIDQDF